MAPPQLEDHHLWEEPDDGWLVARARQDRAAFAALYARYVDRIYAYCYRRTGSPDEAADATSTIFLRALVALDSCQPERFRSWLFAIAHHALIDSYRSQKGTIPLDAERWATLRATDFSPEEAVLDSEQVSTVTALLGMLTPDQRHILELRMCGLTSKEIGIVLGKHPNAIDQAQYRAVQRLRALAGQPGHREQLEGIR